MGVMVVEGCLGVLFCGCGVCVLVWVIIIFGVWVVVDCWWLFWGVWLMLRLLGLGLLLGMIVVCV
ncbi:MAG: hypothetical protein DRO11_09510 [Methanobacteriota archaeon]|nr:MAG: hypothetical protein DRO11_09510 [Euryarchaeota archaeon]